MILGRIVIGIAGAFLKFYITPIGSMAAPEQLQVGVQPVLIEPIGCQVESLDDGQAVDRLL